MTPATDKTMHCISLAQAQKELAKMAADLAIEQAISARFLQERDAVIIAAQLESARLTAELAVERGIITRLFQGRDEILTTRKSTCRHTVLSSYIGEYTSEFLDTKSDFQRTSLLSSIRWMTKNMWDSGAGLSCEVKIRVIRRMMAYYGFRFRDPGEGETGGDGYSTKVPDVGVVEQLGRVVRTQRVEMGEMEWYLNELTAVLLRVGEYLESNL